MSEVDTFAPGAPRRRRRWPWVVAGSLALAALAVGLAPSLLGGFAARTVADGFNQQFEGRLEIAALDLGWTARQELREARLLDPAGGEIARVSVELPSLLALARSGGAKLGKISVRARADLVADDEGVTNLDRALAERPGRKASPTAPSSDEPALDLGELLRELELEFDVLVERLTWSDATTRAAGKPFAIENMALGVRALPGQPLQATLRGALAGLSSGAVRVEAKLHDVFAGAELNPAARFELEAAFDELPSALIDTLAQQDGLVAMALGPNFRVAARGAGTFTSGSLSFGVQGRDGRLDFSGAIVDGVLGGRDPAQLEIVMTPQRESLARVLASRAPEGLALEALDDLELRVLLEDLRLDVASILQAANSGADVVDAALTGAAGRVTALAGNWRASGDLLSGGGAFEARALRLDAALARTDGRTGLELRAGCAVAGAGAAAGNAAPPTQVALELLVSDLAQAIALPERGELGSAALELTLSKLPSDLLAQLAPAATDSVAKLPAGPVSVTSLARLTRSAPAQLDVAVRAGEGARALALDVRATVEDPLGVASRRPEGALPPLDVTIDVAGARWLASWAPEEFASTVEELVGDRLAASVALRPAPDATGIDDLTVSAQLESAGLELTSRARLAAQVLSIQPDAPLVLGVRTSPAMMERFVGPSLPEGATFSLTHSDPSLVLRVTRLEAPLSSFLAESGEAPAPLGDFVRKLRLDLLVEAPDATYAQPPLAGGAGAVPVSIAALQVKAALAGGGAASFGARGSLAGAKSSELAFDASCADLGALVDAFSAETEGLPAIPAAARLTVAGNIEGLPTALVDALAAQDGLLVDVLGATMDLKLSGGWPSTAEDPLRAEMSSPTASVKVEAGLDGAVLRAQDGGGIDAKLPLSPLFSERIVGKLVPLCVNAAKPKGAAPVGLSVRQFELPLDGDLSKLNGVVELDLGEIVYDFLPGLSSTLAPLGLAGATRATTRIEKLSLPIVNGVVSYDRLPLSIGGREVAFRGAFDLAKLEFDLSTSVPLEALGAKFSNELEQVRKYLDPKLPIPLQLKGTWSSPRLRIADDFSKGVLKKAAEKAAGDALKGGLQDLLGGKKKDG